MVQEPVSKSRAPRKTKLRINWLRVIGLIVLLGFIFSVGLVTYVGLQLPEFDPQLLSGTNSTLLYDDSGQPFSSLHAGENRTEVALEKIPVVLQQAFIATEDKAFYDHHGVTLRGIARALLRNVQSGDLTGQGASTITQQLARSAFLTADKNWLRKMKEVLLAVKIEMAFSKDEILEMYLNKIPFGAGAYGVQAAANTYFAKDVGQLTLPEASLLAGLVQSPSNYNPFINMDKAKARQKLVLASMVDSGFISDADANTAFEAPLNLAKGQSTANAKYGFFVDAVIDEAVQILQDVKGYEDAEGAIYKSGLKIYTTANAPLQAYAEEYFKNAAHFPASNVKDTKIQAGMAIIDNRNGDIKALMGGRDYEVQRGFNRATDAYRQPGSSIKPLTVYSPALEEGQMPYLVLDDSPVSYKTDIGIWEPKNYDGNYRGLITMRTAVQYSINTYAVQLLDLVGIRHGFDMGRSLGLTLVDTPGRNDLNLASLALGGLTKGATPVQMAAAYSTFGNTGLYNAPHFINKIIDANGVVIYEFKPASKRVMSEQTSWLMNNLLQSVVSSGTGINAKVPNVPTAGKTGTSEELTDAWFCGITPLYSGAVWMGYDDQKYKMVNSFGGGSPALMFKAMMQKLYQTNKPGSWSMPANIIQVTVCSKSGKLPSPLCPKEQTITEYCLKNYAPTASCTIHENVVVCAETGKLATPYCPLTKTISVVKTGAASYDSTKLPTESCPLHGPGTSGSGSSVVVICTDPRHNGLFYKANIPSSGQSGGCPSQYLQTIVVQSSEKLPTCNLKDHQIKR